MAHISELPCDGDGVCMKCKKKPLEEDKLPCKTCDTPWHLDCLLFPPQTLASALQFLCPDCSPATTVTTSSVVAAVEGGGGGDLVVEIRRIEADLTLTEDEKAKRRQDLLSGGVKDDSDVLDLLDGSLNCTFCLQLLEKPVTTPCGHNFCLKCFQKWIGQGKRTCAKCRNKIPPKMASQPRINSSLVAAIRMARMSKPSTKEPLKVYRVVHDQNRPDKAFTTERAKRSGKSNACSGKIFVTVPSDHFGPILAENDPERKQGVLVGESWEDRLDCRQWGIHLPHVAGIAGQSEYGAQSVALSGGYEDDEDHGEWFLYTGSGGRDLSGNKRTNKEQSFDQKFEKYNEALRVSCKKGYPVRVVRSHKEKRSSYAPEIGVRYDGIYRIEKCWRKVGIQGFKVCRFLFVRCDNEPAPWTSDKTGDLPRPFPVIKELKKATDITGRSEKPSWDYDNVEGCWKWTIPPPMSRMSRMSRKAIAIGDSEERKRATTATKLEQNVSIRENHLNVPIRAKLLNMSIREKLLKEFACLICRKVMSNPLTTPCAHNFCKPCLEGVFAGQNFVRERTCEGGRTLRTQKNIMKCPSCQMDISDFLQSPQINRELMGVIESLRGKTEEDVKEASDNIENLSKEESVEAGVGETEVCTERFEMLESGNKAIQNSPTKRRPKQTKIADEQNEKCLVKKCHALKIDKSDVSVKDEMPGSGKEDMQTPKTNSRPKRKKADNDNSGSTQGGVRTRSMRSKELLDEGNDCRAEKREEKQPYKRKKANDADSVLKPGGVKTRSSNL